MKSRSPLLKSHEFFIVLFILSASADAQRRLGRRGHGYAGRWRHKHHHPRHDEEDDADSEHRNQEGAGGGTTSDGTFRLTADPDWDSVNGYTF
jgi:hypothetical protein